MKRFEILSLLPAESPYFTVNTAVSAVDIITPLDGTYNTPFPMTVAGGATHFYYGENIEIISAGFTLPEQFTLKAPADNLYQSYPALAVGLWRMEGTPIPSPSVYYTPQFGTFGFQCPLEGYELPIGAYVSSVERMGGSGNTDNFAITCNFNGLYVNPTPPPASVLPQVSMIGVPAALDGVKFYVSVFVKVAHTLAMVGK